MSTNPPSDANTSHSGAEPVYGPPYAAAQAERVSGARAAVQDPVGPQPPAVDGPSPPYAAPYPPYPSDTPPTYGLSPTVASGLAYFTIIPAIFFLLMDPYKSNRTVRFHSWQSVFFFLAVVAVRAVETVLDAMLPAAISFGFASLLSLVLLAAWLVVVVQAFGGKRYLLPWIGGIAEKTSGGGTTL
jgi:uncharacterized membrane protein